MTRARRADHAGNDESLALARQIAHLALERQARDVKLLFVGDTLGIADWFVLATVHNRRQARAVRDAVRVALRESGVGMPRAASEDPDGRWSLYDYGAVIVHLFDEEGRSHFALDQHWKDAPSAPLQDEGGEAEPDGEPEAAAKPKSTAKSAAKPAAKAKPEPKPAPKPRTAAKPAVKPAPKRKAAAPRRPRRSAGDESGS